MTALNLCHLVALVDSTPPIEYPEGQYEGDDIHDAATEPPLDIPPISLRSLNAVSSHIPRVQAAREQVVGEMEAMLVTGVQELVGCFRDEYGPLYTNVAPEQTASVFSAANRP